jgi:virulence-associated protein VagC
MSNFGGLFIVAETTSVSTLLTQLPVVVPLHRRRAVRAKVKKWGNSAAVRIPASVMQATRFDLDEVVDVREEAGRIVIEPLRQKTTSWTSC